MLVLKIRLQRTRCSCCPVQCSLWSARLVAQEADFWSFPRELQRHLRGIHLSSQSCNSSPVPNRSAQYRLSQPMASQGRRIFLKSEAINRLSCCTCVGVCEKSVVVIFFLEAVTQKVQHTLLRPFVAEPGCAWLFIRTQTLSAVSPVFLGVGTHIRPRKREQQVEDLHCSAHVIQVLDVRCGQSKNFNFR